MGERKTVEGGRHLKERKGKIWPREFPEGGQWGYCLRASTEEAGTLAAGEGRLVAQSSSAGRLEREVLGLKSVQEEMRPGLAPLGKLKVCSLVRHLSE